MEIGKRSKIFETLRIILGDLLNIDPESIKLTDTLESLGVADIDRIEICYETQNSFKIGILEDSIRDSWKTVQDILLCIENAIEGYPQAIE